MEASKDAREEVVEAVLRGLVKMQRFDLVEQSWVACAEGGLPTPPHLATVVVKAMCRSQSGGLVTAMGIVSELEVQGIGEWKEVYPVAAQAALRTGRVSLARDLVIRLKGSRDSAPVTTYNYLIKQFGKAGSLQGVFLVLDAMKEAGVEADAETLEFLSNAAVRQIEFVKGAVSVDTLPDPLPEACFAGRSNVGKSSLVNMLSNRKKLAFSSKTPGKTQQFNYFVVNGQDDVGNKFHLVDLPGVGYAKVPVAVRREWVGFLTSYLTQRESLKVLFHLVDSRHGPQKDDLELMKLYAETKCSAAFVVVLTKIDKIDGKVRQSIVDGVRDALVECGCSRDTPILQTSAETKRGRDEVWNYLKLAALASEQEETDDERRNQVEEELRQAAVEAEANRVAGGPKRASSKRAAGGAKKADKKKGKGAIKSGIRREPFNGQELYVKAKSKRGPNQG
eukprot:CAMPEP_0114164698 /NCGR_PEP_ID=MMETSP0043_2-20121206/30811_1 /TAXON_ID=464988 /ORGANISM="Hemiselmis andersenii, Strain CCMP644" /LENGTH=449 /DNA_ID=CAMNT_0001261385 /DNA_START=1 /DNA_END=1347 /DNA_ORIENTATION=+